MTSVYDFSARTIEGREQRLDAYKGKVLLIVNVASECGFTPQYSGLEALQKRYGAQGFSVLGFPSNQFGAQEPGTEAEIANFCEKNYGVTFPLAGKQKVIGAGAHPLYRWIAAELGEGAAPKWNFHKYLIGPDGALAGAWPSKVAPKSPEIAKAIAEALG